MYVNEKDKAKIRKLAEREGITMTKLCRNVIAQWVQSQMGAEEEAEYE